jgi:hypothetical protein
MRQTVAGLVKQIDPNDPTSGMLDIGKALTLGGKTNEGLDLILGAIKYSKDAKTETAIKEWFAESQSNPDARPVDLAKGLIAKIGPSKAAPLMPLLKMFSSQDPDTVEEWKALAIKAAATDPVTGKVDPTKIKGALESLQPKEREVSSLNQADWTEASWKKYTETKNRTDLVKRSPERAPREPNQSELISEEISARRGGKPAGSGHKAFRGLSDDELRAMLARAVNPLDVALGNILGMALSPGGQPGSPIQPAKPGATRPPPPGGKKGTYKDPDGSMHFWDGKAWQS